jgi:hypothetical protein
VTNKYQNNTLRTSTGPRLAVPDALTIAMGEIAGDMCQGLLALAVGAGVSVGRSLGWGRVGVQRPLMCSADGAGEVPVPAYELFSQRQILGRRRGERCLGIASILGESPFSRVPYPRPRRRSGAMAASRMSSMVRTPIWWSSWSRTGRTSRL